MRAAKRQTEAILAYVENQAHEEVVHRGNDLLGVTIPTRVRRLRAQPHQGRRLEIRDAKAAVGHRSRNDLLSSESWAGLVLAPLSEFGV